MTEGFLITTMLVGVAGALLSAGLLVCDRWFGPRPTRWIAGAATIAFLGAIYWCLFSSLPLRDWWPLLPFAAVLAVISGLLLARDPVHLVLSIVRGRLVWSCLLIACLLAANWAAFSISRRGDSIPPVPESVQYSEPLAIAPRGVTALGRQITLYQYLPIGEDERQLELDILQDDLRIARNYPDQVIRTGDPDTQCNCHGFVFTGGQFAVHSRDVESILADNGYCPVEIPEPLDVVVWRGMAGKVIHSGLVRAITRKGDVIVESKWGPLGIYLHPVDASPYGTSFTYYRCGSEQPDLLIEYPGRRRRSRPFQPDGARTGDP